MSTCRSKLDRYFVVFLLNKTDDDFVFYVPFNVSRQRKGENVRFCAMKRPTGITGGTS